MPSLLLRFANLKRRVRSEKESEAAMTRLKSPELAGQAARLADMTGALFEVHDPAVQGLALAELTAQWLAAHPAALRDQTFEGHTATVRQLYRHAPNGWMPPCDNVRPDDTTRDMSQAPH